MQLLLYITPLSHCLTEESKAIHDDWLVMVSIETLWPIAVGQESAPPPMIRAESPWTTEY